MNIFFKVYLSEKNPNNNYIFKKDHRPFLKDLDFCYIESEFTALCQIERGER